MGIELGIVFGLVAMMGLGLCNGISQEIVRKIGVSRSVFFRNLFIVLMLIPFAACFLPSAPPDPLFVLIALAIGLIGYLPLAFFSKAINLGKIGTITPISNSPFIITILLSVVFFGEILSLLNILSLALIIVGIILISVDFRDLKNSDIFRISSGIPFAFVAFFLWGIVFFLLKIPVNVIGPIITSLLLESGVLAGSKINMIISRKGWDLPERRTLFKIFLMSLTGFLGSLFYNLGISVMEVSIVVALTFSNPLVSVLYGKFVYGEKLGVLQYVAIIMIITGIVSISLF